MTDRKNFFFTSGLANPLKCEPQDRRFWVVDCSDISVSESTACVDPMREVVRRFTCLPRKGTPAANLTKGEKLALCIAAGAPTETVIEGGFLAVRTTVPCGIADRGDGGYIVAVGADEREAESNQLAEPTGTGIGGVPLTADRGVPFHKWSQLAVGMLAVLFLAGCGPVDPLIPAARAEARIALFKECMQLAAKLERRADDDVSDVVSQCSQQAFYMTNYIK
jgi:hypothetical protein